MVPSNCAPQGGAQGGVGRPRPPVGRARPPAGRAHVRRGGRGLSRLHPPSSALETDTLILIGDAEDSTPVARRWRGTVKTNRHVLRMKTYPLTSGTLSLGLRNLMHLPGDGRLFG